MWFTEFAYMHNPYTSHIKALKQIIRYVHGTLPYKLHLSKLFASRLVGYIQTQIEKDA